jgi:hypothetical protein
MKQRQRQRREADLRLLRGGGLDHRQKQNGAENRGDAGR